MIHILVFLFLAFNFIITFFYVRIMHIKDDWRDNFISASLYFGLGAISIAEILSALLLITPIFLFISWLVYDFIILILINYRKSKAGLNSKAFFNFNTEILKNPLFLFTCLILFVTFFISIVYPPNNWDSMTYHLPRVEEWIQSRNLNHYYTSNPRQTMYAPFAEILILHGRALSSSDWLMNLVQWFSFAGTIIAISKITSLLGLNTKSQLITAVFLATLPIAILESTSTQNDLVVTFWLTCMVERLLIWKKDKLLRFTFDFGLALGLAISTKGTAYPIALPFVLVFAFISLKSYKKYLLYAIFAGLISLSVNLPHLLRNYNYFGNPIEANDETMSSFTLKSFIFTGLSNVYVNTPLPLPFSENINQKLETLDKSIFPYGKVFIFNFNYLAKSLGEIAPFHEDAVKNPLHTILLIGSFVFILFKKGISKMYLFMVFASLCTFVFCIPWQPWITRLQLPLFALSAPLFSIAFQYLNSMRLKQSGILILCIYSLFPLFMNASRPLVFFSSVPLIRKWAKKENTIWYNSRDRLIFNNNKSLYDCYTNACEVIVKNKKKDIGLIIGMDTWEYPIWRYIRNNSEAMPKIHHVGKGHIKDSVDALFISEVEKINFSGPVVCGRNKENSNWDIEYLANKLSILNIEDLNSWLKNID